MKKRIIQFMGDDCGKQVKSAYEAILEKYANQIGTDIVFILCHGDFNKIPHDMDFDRFYIFGQLLPKSFEGVKRFQINHFTIDGKKMVLPNDKGKCPQGDSLTFSKPEEKVFILYDAEKQPMAVVSDCSLYILNDFIHCRSKAELETSIRTFHYIMKEVMKGSDLLKFLKAGIEEKSKRSLSKALVNQFAQRLDKEKIQLRAARDTITSYEKGMADCFRKLYAGERIIHAIQNNIKDVPKALDRTWAEIQRMNGSERYEKISFMKTGLRAITTPVEIHYGGAVYDMGRFEVLLNFNGDTKIYSLSEKSKQTPHPHVSNGQPCWGNMAGLMPKYIGSSEFGVALMTAYEFLAHYDSASPYSTIDHWPKLTKAKTAKASKASSRDEEEDEDE